LFHLPFDVNLLALSDLPHSIGLQIGMSEVEVFLKI
jgi:hypothetical protein